MAITDHLGGIAAFVHTAEAGSFSAAAGRLALSRSAVAKSVARLEERVRTRLFHRTTRSLHLTEDGEVFYRHCLRVLAELEQAEAVLAGEEGEVSGRLRITMPVLLGQRCIAPVLFALAQRHPRLQLELSFADRRADLVEEGFDLAVRSGPLPDSHAFRMRPLGMQHMVLCAAPAYLAARGVPAGLDALSGFEALRYGRGGRVAQWRFARPGGGETLVEIPARICMDDLQALLDAARAGLGIARLPVWLAGPDLASGALLPVLPAERSAGYPLHLLWPASRQHSRRLRVVIDELAATLPGYLEGD